MCKKVPHIQTKQKQCMQNVNTSDSDTAANKHMTAAKDTKGWSALEKDMKHAAKLELENRVHENPIPEHESRCASDAAWRLQASPTRAEIKPDKVEKQSRTRSLHKMHEPTSQAQLNSTNQTWARATVTRGPQ